MISEEELWLELYKFISDKNNHNTIEVNNTHGQSSSIRITTKYFVGDYSGDDEWEIGCIESNSKCSTLAECLVDIVNKLRKEEWVY